MTKRYRVFLRAGKESLGCIYRYQGSLSLPYSTPVPFSTVTSTQVPFLPHLFLPRQVHTGTNASPSVSRYVPLLQLGTVSTGGPFLLIQVRTFSIREDTYLFLLLQVLTFFLSQEIRTFFYRYRYVSFSAVIGTYPFLPLQVQNTYFLLGLVFIPKLY